MAKRINTSERTVVINVDGKEEIARLNKLLEEADSALDTMESELEEARQKARELSDTIANMKFNSGVDVLEEELRRFRRTAAKSIEEFQVFLKSVNLDQVDDADFDRKIRALFNNIERGSLTASQAIAKVKDEFAHLMEENYGKSGNVFDTKMVAGFQVAMERLGATMDTVLNKLEQIETNGVKSVGAAGGGGAGFGDLAEMMHRVMEASKEMSDTANGSVDSISNLVGALGRYASIDSSKLLSVSQAFRNMADMGSGSFSTKSVDNLIRLANELSRMNENGSFRMRFDLTGLKDVKISSTIHHITDLVNSLQSADVSKLQALQGIDLSGWNNVKISKESLDSLTTLLKTISVEEQKARQSAATSTALGGERDVLGTLNAAYEKHITTVGRAAEAEQKKAQAARNVVAAMKAESAASAKSVNAAEFSKIMDIANRYKAAATKMINTDEASNPNRYAELNQQVEHYQKLLNEAAQSIELNEQQARKLAAVFEEVKNAARLKEADNADKAAAEERARAAKEAAAAEKEAAAAAKEAAREKAAADKEAAAAAKEEENARKQAAAAEKERQKYSAQKAAMLRQINTMLEQSARLQDKFRLLGSDNKDLNAIKNYSRQLQDLRSQVESATGSVANFKPKLDQLSGGFATAKANLTTFGGAISRYFNNGLAQLASRLTYTFGLVNIFMKTTQEIKKMISTAVELDSAMNQLQIVTRASGTEMDDYAKRVSAMAKDTAQATKDLIDATTVYARLGYNMDESGILAKYTAMLQGVGNIDASSAQNAMTAIIKAFDMDVSNVEEVMDKMVVVGNNFPISVSQIAEGMNNAGSMLAVAKNGLDESIALLTAANTTVQDISKASTGLRTIAARIRKTTTGEEDGEVINESKYEEMLRALTKHKVSLVDINGEYRSTYAVMKDIAAVWKDLTTMEQAAVIEALAGTRQQNVFSSIVTQFGEAEEAMKRMSSSAGELEESYSIYMDSIQAHVTVLKDAFAELSRDFVDGDFAKGAVDVLTKIVEGLDKLVRTFGVLGSIAGVAGIVAIIANFAKIKAAFSWLFAAGTGAAMGKNLLGLSAAADKLAVTFAAIPAPVIAATAVLVAFGVAVAALNGPLNEMNPSLEHLKKNAAELTKEADKAQEEADHVANKLKENNERLEELEEIKTNGEWTETLRNEEEGLRRQNEQLEAQLAVLEKIAEHKRRDAVNATNEAFTAWRDTPQYQYAEDDTPWWKNMAAVFWDIPVENEDGFGSMQKALEEYEKVKEQLEELNVGMISLKDAKHSGSIEEYEKLLDTQKTLQSLELKHEQELGEYLQTLYAWRDTLAGATDEESVANLAEINELIDTITSSINKNVKGFDDFKKKMDGLSSNTLKKFLSGVKLNKDEMKEFVEWLQKSGYSSEEAAGYLKRYIDELKANQDAAQKQSAATENSIANISGFKDELREVTSALEEYNKAMEGGEKGDAAKQMADIYKGALEDIEAGRIDSNKMHAAANLFFSEEQLAAWGYDLMKVAQALNSDMMKELFDPEGNSQMDFGARFADYVKRNFSKASGVWVDDNKLFYNSIDDVARAFGMSKEACEAFLDSLDAYGISVMRSNQDNTDLANRFREIQNEAANAGDTVKAVAQMIEELREGGRDKFEIASILQDLQTAGVIDMDTTQLNQTLSTVWAELDALDKKDSEASASMDISPAMSSINELASAIDAIIHDYTVTVYLNTDDSGVQTSFGEEVPHRAGGKTPKQRGGKTLVNELGPELISDQGEAYIANGGHPGFTDLSDDAIVFTAEETEKILRGEKTVRAKAYKDGTGRAGLRERLLGGGRTAAHSGKYCPNCGKKCNVWAYTCSECGYDFGAAELEPEPEPEPVYEPPPGWQCAWCGSWNLGTDYWCQSCGATQDGQAPESNNTVWTEDPGWQCAVCQMWNRSYDSTCVACGSPKGTQPVSDSELFSNVSWPTETPNVEAGWQCEYCLNWNLGTDYTCQSCGASKYGNSPPRTQTSTSSVTTNKTTSESAPGWTCPFCDQYNSSNRSVCWNCGNDPRKYVPISQRNETTKIGTTKNGTTQTTNIGHNIGGTRIGNTGAVGKTGGYTGSPGSNTRVGNTSSQSQAEPQKTDWIAVRINRQERNIADLDQVATSGLKSLETRLSSAKDEAEKLNEEIVIMLQGYDRYIQEANSVGLSESLAEKVRNGTIDINAYDANTQKLIQSYQEWYEKALDCQSAIEGLDQSVSQLYVDAFATVQTDYENNLAHIAHTANMISEELEKAQAKGYTKTADYYDKLLDSESEQHNQLKKEYDALTDQLSEAMRNGNIKEGTEAWHDMKKEIEAVEEAIAESEVKTIQYRDTIRSIKWSNIQEDAERELNTITHQANMISQDLALAEAKGYTKTAEYYEDLIDKQNSSIKGMKSELSSLQSYFDKALREGMIDEDSQYFYSMRDDIRSLEESIAEANVQLQEYRDTVRSIRWSNIQEDAQRELDVLTHQANMINQDIAMAEAKGYLENANYYQQLISNQKSSISGMETELRKLKDYFQKALDTGLIDKNSSAFYEMSADIRALEESLAEANVQLTEYDKKIRQIQWDTFDYAQSRFEQIANEAEFLSDIMSNDKLFEDNGKMTRTGMATLGMSALRYDAYMSQADAYAKELLNIQKQLAANPADTALIERREKLLDLQQKSIKAAESEKDAVKSLVKEGFDLELNSLKELIDAYNDSIDSAKDLYEYQKRVSDSTEEISSIQKQLAAYANDTSEESRARVQQLNKSLKDAQENLRETEWDRNISEQKKILDDLYENYEEILNNRLDDVDALMKEMIETADQNSRQIYDEVHRIADRVGYDVTQDMDRALRGDYTNYEYMFESVSGAAEALKSIERMVASIAQIGGNAKAYAKGGLIDYTGIAAVHGSPGNPEMVLSAADTAKFLEAARLMQMVNGISSIPVGSFANGSYGGGLNIGSFNVSIPIDHVQDYNDMVRQMQNDPKFEKLINAMTLDRVTGQSAFGKNRISF